MSNPSDSLRGQIQRLRVPKTIIVLQDGKHIETTNLLDKTVDELLALFKTHSLQERKKAAVRGYGCDNDEDFRELIKQLEEEKEAL